MKRKLYVVLFQEIEIDDGEDADPEEWSLEGIRRTANAEFGTERGVSKFINYYVGDLPQGSLSEYRLIVYEDSPNQPGTLSGNGRVVVEGDLQSFGGNDLAGGGFSGLEYETEVK